MAPRIIKRFAVRTLGENGFFILCDDGSFWSWDEYSDGRKEWVALTPSFGRRVIDGFVTHGGDTDFSFQSLLIVDEHGAYYEFVEGGTWLEVARPFKG